MFPGPDPFAVIGVHVEVRITIHGLCLRVLTKCMEQVLEWNGVALTEDPFWPTCSQINQAISKLTVDDSTLRNMAKRESIEPLILDKYTSWRLRI